MVAARRSLQTRPKWCSPGSCTPTKAWKSTISAKHYGSRDRRSTATCGLSECHLPVVFRLVSRATSCRHRSWTFKSRSVPHRMKFRHRAASKQRIRSLVGGNCDEGLDNVAVVSSSWHSDSPLPAEVNPTSANLHLGKSPRFVEPPSD